MSGVPGWMAGVPAPRGAPVRRFPPLEKLGDFHGLRAAVAFWYVAGWYVAGGERELGKRSQLLGEGGGFPRGVGVGGGRKQKEKEKKKLCWGVYLFFFPPGKRVRGRLRQARR